MVSGTESDETCTDEEWRLTDSTPGSVLEPCVDGLGIEVVGSCCERAGEEIKRGAEGWVAEKGYD